MAESNPPTPPAADPADELAREEKIWLDQVYRGDRLRELTLRSILLGVALCALVVTLDVYMGLKTGLGISGALISCILGFAVMKALGQVDRQRGAFTELELNMSQTLAGAGAALGDIINVIPALFLLGGFMGAAAVLFRPDGSALIPAWWEIFAWCLFTSLLGVTFALPLRRQLLMVDKLRFPTGTAAAEAVKVMFSRGAEPVKQARGLALAGLWSFLLVLVSSWNYAGWLRDRIPGWLLVQPAYFAETVLGLFGAATPAIFGCPPAALTLGIAMSPMLFGAGFLVGPRVGGSLALGAAVMWIGVVPALHHAGILADIAATMTAADPQHREFSPLSYKVMVKWTLWPALGLMMGAGLGSLAMRGGGLVQALRSMVRGLRGGGGPTAHLDLPFPVWLATLLVAFAGIEVLLVWRFGVAWWVGLLVVPLAAVLSAVAMRATGETDVVPSAPMGAFTQVVYGLIHPGHVGTNLLTGGVTAAAAGEASNMMVDLKTGHLLGSTPRRLAYSQLIGIAVGAALATPIFLLFLHSFGICNEAMPTPGALTWSGLAQMMARGGSALPPGAILAFGAALVIGLELTALDLYRGKRGPWTPSVMGLGIAMILPAFYSAALFGGALAYMALGRWAPGWTGRYGIAIAAGAIAGEGLAGLAVAILRVVGLL